MIVSESNRGTGRGAGGGVSYLDVRGFDVNLVQGDGDQHEGESVRDNKKKDIPIETVQIR